MTWVATAGATTYPILSPRITKRLEGANTASFQCPANIPVGTTVTIKSNGTTVYYGKVRSIKRRTDNLNTVELMEPASDLKLFRLEDNGSGIVTIDNSSYNKRLADYIAIILNGTGWSDGTGSTITINPVTGEPFPSIRFYNTTVAKALEKMISLVCGYKMWFDNVNKRVKYGNYNTDRSAVALSTIDVRPTSSDINYNIDRIIVIGKTEDIYGEAIKSGATTPYKTLMYQYTECADSTEAQSIAKQILADRSVLMERFECDILPGNYIYEEGDLVRISDVKTGTYGTYGIKDIEISEEKTTLGLGCSEITIFDLLGDKLTEISGSAFNGVDEIWTGGKQNIGTTAPATYFINIADKTAIDSFILSLKFDRWSKDIALAGATSNVGLGQGGVSSSGSDTKLTTLTGTGNAYAGGTNSYTSPLSMLTRLYSTWQPSDMRFTGTNRILTYVATNFTGGSTYYMTLPDTAEGYNFLMLELSMDIKFKATTSYVNIWIYIYSKRGGDLPIPKEETYLAGVIPRRIYPSLNASNTGDPIWQVAHLDILYPLYGVIGGTGDPTYYEIMLSADTSISGNVVMLKGYANLVCISNHDHSFSPTAHYNPISGAGHAHSTSTLHNNHPVYDSDHYHSETNNKSTVGSGPSNLSLSITNALYPSGHVIESGITGGIRTYNKDITAFLSNGNNIISISSTTIGSVEASASFINYGK